MPLPPFLSPRNHWSGGLHFGPAAWTPALLDPAPLDSSTGAWKLETGNFSSLASLLESSALLSTGPLAPSLTAQLRDLGSDDPALFQKRRRIRALVLNLLPTQPESALPFALMRQFPEDLLAGLSLIAGLISPRRIIAAVDHDDRGSLRVFQHALKLAAPTASPVLIQRFHNRFPQAHPTLLLRSLFGKKLAPGQLPTRANRFILDPVSAWALGRLTRTGALPAHRPVQLFIESQPPRLLLAKIGAPIADILQDNLVLHGISDAPSHLSFQTIRNGMLLGEEIEPITARIDWSTEIISLRALPRHEHPAPCIACGWCVDHCPTALSPIALYIQSKLPAVSRSAESLESRHCIGCGLCSYVCPTRLPLTSQIIRLATEVALHAVTEDPTHD